MAMTDTTRYVHKEAFCLMWYTCPCGHRERIWNSRDGVTPFGGLRCPSCGESGLKGGLTHTDFHLDDCQPDHKMIDGQMFFRDGTTGDAITIIKRRIRIFAERGQSIPERVAERLLDAARNQRDEWRPGWPMLDRYSWSTKSYVERYRGMKDP